jgi:1-acyl-sn-glycerol-3-phosphate acyltransferase
MEQKHLDEVFKSLKKRYSEYQDPWGFDIETCRKALSVLLPLYEDYFKVRVFGKENVKDSPYMVVGNHSGQIPIDAILVGMAFALELEPPRVLRAMVERFLAGLPFLGKLSAQMGSILGDRKNCQYLLENGESILVFPEGVRGVSKSTPDYYQLQKFTTGFFRIALKADVEILPIAVVGAEEMFPFVYQAKGLAKMLKLPALPITPLPFPLPSPVDIYIGKPYKLPKELTYDSKESEVREHVFRVENQIKSMMAKGLKNRRPFFEDVRAPVQDFIKEWNKRGK